MAPAAPIIVAATGLGAVAAYFVTRRDSTQQRAPGSLSNLANSRYTHANPGSLQTRPVSYRHNADTTAHYGTEQRWARDGSVMGSWKSY
ncbi:uncharacterized protein EV422DRAFT_539346 [Fimicolochytrium jonesii]|uniref:uncharacterized protein n=1 Tax=Fimicolochytrium jonesii TaxID=1396493 RepID=UPI0022FEEE3E|nr:uncharacterized protein EV422DRAFT_539346 [Fimicolochytrium jonesii]KAI8817919.1 hypothetical protein EV422DRAFT_539346 [Fimicolochytrium jonesii]